MVDKSTDIDLRSYLAQQGLKKGDLSKFIEEAVRWRLYDLSLRRIQQGLCRSLGR